MKSIFSKRVVPRKSTFLNEKSLLGELILSDSEEILFRILTKWLRILRKNVAMVLIKLLPNAF